MIFSPPDWPAYGFRSVNPVFDPKQPYLRWSVIRKVDDDIVYPIWFRSFTTFLKDVGKNLDDLQVIFMMPQYKNADPKLPNLNAGQCLYTTSSHFEKSYLHVDLTKAVALKRLEDTRIQLDDLCTALNPMLAATTTDKIKLDALKQATATLKSYADNIPGAMKNLKSFTSVGDNDQIQTLATKVK